MRKNKQFKAIPTLYLSKLFTKPNLYHKCLLKCKHHTQEWWNSTVHLLQMNPCMFQFPMLDDVTSPGLEAQKLFQHVITQSKEFFILRGNLGTTCDWYTSYKLLNRNQAKTATHGGWCNTDGVWIPLVHLYGFIWAEQIVWMYQARRKINISKLPIFSTY